MTEIQQSKQAEIDELKAQLKAAHESRADFVEYCRKIESGDFVLVPKEPTDAMLFAASGRDIVAEHYGDENIMWPELRETWKAMLEAAKDLEKALKNG